MKIERDNLSRIAVTALAETMGVPVAVIRMKVGIRALEDQSEERPVQRWLWQGQQLSAWFRKEDTVDHIGYDYAL